MLKKVATFSTLLTKIKTKQSNRKNYSRFLANLADTIPGFLPEWWSDVRILTSSAVGWSWIVFSTCVTDGLVLVVSRNKKKRGLTGSSLYFFCSSFLRKRKRFISLERWTSVKDFIIWILTFATFNRYIEVKMIWSFLHLYIFRKSFL